MSFVPFDRLPDHARLWVFPADRPLAPAETDRLGAAVESSLADWNAHGSPVTWGHTLLHDQFLLIGVDETRTALSGCSIDSAVARIQDLERDLGVSMLDSHRVFYRDGARIAWAPRPEFKTLAASGSVTGDTVVFDTVIATVGDLRSGRLEVPARDTWHARAFPLRV